MGEVFYREICKIFKYNFLVEHLQTTASELVLWKYCFTKQNIINIFHKNLIFRFYKNESFHYK